jgi:glycosyltransferase involved in cell wall biosynthesis
VTRALRTLVKPLLLGAILLLHVPLAVLSVLHPRKRGTRSQGADPICLVTPFAPSDHSGGARAVQDFVSILRDREGFRVVNVEDLSPKPGRVHRWLGALLAWPLPVPPQCSALIAGHHTLGRALRDASTVVFESFATALLLYLRRPPAARIVLRDYEVLVRKLRMEYDASTGIAAVSHALRLASCYLISFAVYRKVDHIVTLTEEDRAWLVRSFPALAGRTSAIPVPFPVPATGPPSEARTVSAHDLLMVANFFHRPNVDGLLWFLRECAPHLRRNYTLHVCGLDRPLDALDLSDAPVRVVRHGFVDDVEMAVPGAIIAVAPVVSGSGVRIKNLLLASLGKLIVTTPLGNEGIGFINGRDAIIASEGRQMAASLDEIADDPERLAALARNGTATVRHQFSPEAVKLRFDREVFTEASPSV